MSREVAGRSKDVHGSAGREQTTVERRELPGAVLFACTMNAVRSVDGRPRSCATSPEAAATSHSAGVQAGMPDPFAAAVMDEIGIDVSQHNPHTLRDLHDTSFDLIVTLSPEAHHQALELTRTMAVDVEYWPTSMQP